MCCSGRSRVKEALPTVPQQCARFGPSADGHNYTLPSLTLLEAWHKYTRGNLDEFIVLNSYFLSIEVGERPVVRLKQFMEDTPRNDYLFVGEVPQ